MATTLLTEVQAVGLIRVLKFPTSLVCKTMVNILCSLVTAVSPAHITPIASAKNYSELHTKEQLVISEHQTVHIGTKITTLELVLVPLWLTPLMKPLLLVIMTVLSMIMASLSANGILHRVRCYLQETLLLPNQDHQEQPITGKFIASWAILHLPFTWVSPTK